MHRGMCMSSLPTVWLQYDAMDPSKCECSPSVMNAVVYLFTSALPCRWFIFLWLLIRTVPFLWDAYACAVMSWQSQVAGVYIQRFARFSLLSCMMGTCDGDKGWKQAITSDYQNFGLLNIGDRDLTVSCLITFGTLWSILEGKRFFFLRIWAIFRWFLAGWVGFGVYLCRIVLSEGTKLVAVEWAFWSDHRGWGFCRIWMDWILDSRLDSQAAIFFWTFSKL